MLVSHHCLMLPSDIFECDDRWNLRLTMGCLMAFAIIMEAFLRALILVYFVVCALELYEISY